MLIIVVRLDSSCGDCQILLSQFDPNTNMWTVNLENRVPQQHSGSNGVAFHPSPYQSDHFNQNYRFSKECRHLGSSYRHYLPNRTSSAICNCDINISFRGTFINTPLLNCMALVSSVCYLLRTFLSIS